MSSLAAAAGWWAAISVIGWFSFPACKRLFQPLGDGGYGLSRVLGLVVVAYLRWIASVGMGVPNSRASAWLAVALWCMLGLLVGLHDRAALAAWLRSRRANVVAVEIGGLVVFGLYAWFRSHDPAIDHTEEPMDYAFLLSLMVSPHLPPADLWFSGATISYYYGGYAAVAMVAQLLGVVPGVGYNLGLAQTASLFWCGGYTIISTLLSATSTRGRRGRLVAAGGASVTLCASNISGTVDALEQILDARIVSSSSSWTLAQALGSDAWWWWPASRAIFDENLLGRAATVITEFPAFSLILGDLHPHLMSLPYLTAALALAAVVYCWARRPAERPGGPILVLAALLVGYGAFVNTWDLPVALGIICLGGLLGAAQHARTRGPWSSIWPVLGVGLLGVLSVLLYAPFYLNLQSQVRGIGFAYYAKTSLSELFGHWGILLVPIAAEAVAYAMRSARRRYASLWILGTVSLVSPWLVTLSLGGPGRTVIGLAMLMVAGPWSLLVLSALIALLAWRILDHGLGLSRLQDAETPSVMGTVFAFVGLVLIYACEFVFVRDVFASRMNTVFKLYYQAWVLLWLGAIISVWSLCQRDGAWRWMARLCLIAMIVTLAYAPTAAITRTLSSTTSPTLDGTAYLWEENPHEAAVIGWLRANAAAGDVLVEPLGDDFDASTSRVSAWSGVATIIGWPGHEIQWRGDEALVRQRTRDVEQIYAGGDGDEALRILRRYDATYVLLNPRAVADLGLDDEQVRALTSVLEPAFSSGGYRLYGVPLPGH